MRACRPWMIVVTAGVITFMLTRVGGLASEISAIAPDPSVLTRAGASWGDGTAKFRDGPARPIIRAM